MRNRILLVLCIMVMPGLVGKSLAWDYPLDVDVQEITFQYFGNNAALPIKVNNNTYVSTPEWQYSGSVNNTFAYTVGSSPVVRVRFYVHDADTLPSTLTIEAFPAMGDTFWGVGTSTVNVSGAGSTDVYDFGISTGYSLPGSVRKCLTCWSWKINAVNGVEITPRIWMGGSQHTYYIVLSEPKSPMSEPWVDVLDKACTWANGATTDTGIVSGITRGAYNGNFKNYTSSSTQCDSASLNLTELMNTSIADCRDMSAVVQVFSNGLGVSTENVKVRRIYGDFYTKSIDPIGNPGWPIINWDCHQVAWYGSLAYDACIKLNESTPRIPCGESIDGSYKADLYDSGNWSLGEPFVISDVY